jgi:hypothetical protein
MSNLVNQFASPNRTPITTADLRRELPVGTTLHLEFGMRNRFGTLEELPRKALRIERVERDQVGCRDSTHPDPEHLTWLSFPRGGAQSNGVHWYRVDDLLEVHAPTAVFRYRLERAA